MGKYHFKFIIKIIFIEININQVREVVREAQEEEEVDLNSINTKIMVTKSIIILINKNGVNRGKINVKKQSNMNNRQEGVLHQTINVNNYRRKFIIYP